MQRTETPVLLTHHPRRTLLALGSSHSNEQGLQVDDVSDDDCSLASLSGISLDAEEGTMTASALLQEATTRAIAIFEQFSFTDPLIKLDEVYRELGIKNSGDYFSITESSSLHEKKGRSKLWYCSFRCPLNFELKASSCLPLPLLVRAGNQENRDALMEHTLNFFDHYELKDGQVYFQSRRGAKKSAALKTLLLLNKVTNHDTSSQEIFFESTMEAEAHLQAHSHHCWCQQKELSASASHRPPALISRQSQRFPQWVHDLSNVLDVSSQGLVITYQEFFDGGNAELAHTYWKGQPTLLYCTMEIPKKKIKVVGSAFPSKKEARGSALGLLLDTLGRLKQKEEESKLLCKSHLNNYENKMAIYKTCQRQQTKFVFPLSRWARQSFFIPSPKTKQYLYLYELRFMGKSGQLLVPDGMNLNEEDATPLGIIFPADIEPPVGARQYSNPSFLTTFNVPVKKGEVEATTVCLRHRTLLDLGDFGVKDRLESLVHFNRIFIRWHEYGIIDNKPVRNNQFSAPTFKTHNAKANHTQLSSKDRTYLFVPLQFSLDEPQCATSQHRMESINWKLVEDVNRAKMTSYLEPIYEPGTFPFVGTVDPDICPWSCLGFILLLITNALPLPKIATFETLEEEQCPDFKSSHTAWFLGLLSVLLLAYNSISPKRKVNNLNNRFLVDKSNRSTVFVSTGYSCFDARSPFFSIARSYGISGRSKIKHDMKRFYLDVKTASFRSYFFKKTGICIKYPRHPLIDALAVNRLQTIRHGLLHGVRTDCHRKKVLIPELVECLPMPRDALYVAAMVPIFMPCLERQINLMWFSHTIEQLRVPIHAENRKTASFSESDLSRRLRDQRSIPFHTLLDQATTIHPVHYQRLEFFGDTVLGLCLALHAMSCNSSLAFDLEDIQTMVSRAGKNVSLFGAGLRAGLNRLLQSELSSWQSAYFSDNDPQEKSIGETAECAWVGHRVEDFHCAVVPDYRISDVTESVLAAVYLGGMADLDIGFSSLDGVLELLSLPSFPQPNNKAPQNWLTAPCLRSGFPFRSDPSWRSTLEDISTILLDESVVKGQLLSRLVALMRVMGQTTDDFKTKGRWRDHEVVLFLAALFNHDHEGLQLSADEEGMGEDDSMASAASRHSAHLPEGLCRVALLRDTLHCVGANAIKMIITEEAFSRYPNATAGDLFLLQRCALCNDVLAYILVKGGMHQCLLDEKSKHLTKFLEQIADADTIGRGLWGQRKGWILPSGIKGYRQRCRTYGRQADNFLFAGPRYPGIAGTVLYSKSTNGAKVELPDLIFGFNSILGAMVLCFGVEKTWQYVGPFMEEALLLSPEEIRREYRNVSSFVKNNHRGKDHGGSKSLRYSILD
jgi:dsRNA-specific ribonuclease